MATLEQQGRGFHSSSILCRVWMFSLGLRERSPGPPASYNCPTTWPFGCLMPPDPGWVDDGWMHVGSQDLKRKGFYKCSDQNANRKSLHSQNTPPVIKVIE